MASVGKQRFKTIQNRGIRLSLIDAAKQILLWRPSRRQVIVAAVVALLTLILLIILGYIYRWEWVGVGEANRPKLVDENGIPQDIRRVKTLWDWMQLLIIPVVVAIGTVMLNQAAKRRDDKAQADERSREQGAEKRANERALLLKFYDDFFRTYNTTKGIRRMLKAKSEYKASNTRLAIDTAAYNEQMGLLIDTQLQFELLKKQVEANPSLFSELDNVLNTWHQPSLRDNLSKIERYLNKIVREYENRPYYVQTPVIDEPVSAVSKLEEFRRKFDQSSGFNHDFKKPAAIVARALRKTLS